MASNLNNYKNYYDPNFEVTDGGSNPPDSTSQTEYEDFVDKATAFSTALSAFDLPYQNVIATLESGASIDFGTGVTTFPTLQTALNNFNSIRQTRITTIENRVGKPVYKTVAEDDPNDYTEPASSRKEYKFIDYIPLLDTSVSNSKYDITNITPYGTKLYFTVNSMLDDELGYFKEVIKKLSVIDFIYLDIDKLRNQYEVLNNRSKQF